MDDKKIDEMVDNPETDEKLKRIDKSMKAGSGMIIAALEGMGFKLDDKQKEKLEAVYSMSFLMSAMTV